MVLKQEEAQRVVYEDHGDFEMVESNVVDNSRWSIQHEGVFRHIPTNKLYSVCWQVGATESQDEGAFEYEEGVEFVEVEAKEVLIIKYVKVN